MRYKVVITLQLYINKKSARYKFTNLRSPNCKLKSKKCTIKSSNYLLKQNLKNSIQTQNSEIVRCKFGIARWVVSLHLTISKKKIQTVRQKVAINLVYFVIETGFHWKHPGQWFKFWKKKKQMRQKNNNKLLKTLAKPADACADEC